MAETISGIEQTVAVAMTVGAVAAASVLVVVKGKTMARIISGRGFHLIGFVCHRAEPDIRAEG
jgi:hypothetical protein